MPSFILLKSPCVCVCVFKIQRCIIYGLIALNFCHFLLGSAKRSPMKPESKEFCQVRLKSAGNIMDCMQQSWCP